MMTLRGNNSIWTGTIFVDDGLLVATGDNAFGSGPLQINNGTADIEAVSPHGLSTIAAGVELVADTTDNTFRFGGAASQLTINAVIEDDNATATHVEQDISGITILSAPSTYTGLTTVAGGTLIVDHADALGSTAAGTTVTGGTLTFNEPSAEPVNITGSTVNINHTTGDHTGSVGMSTGILNVNGLMSGPIHMTGGQTNLKDAVNALQSAVSTSGGALHADVPVGSARLAGQWTLAAGDMGTAVVPAGHTFSIEGGTSGQGSLLLQNDGVVNVSSQGFAHDGGLVLQGAGTLHINTNSSVGDAALFGGTIKGSNTLSVTNRLEERSGSIQFNFSNPQGLGDNTNLSKVGVGHVQSVHIGSDVELDVEIQEGTLSVSNTYSLGSASSNVQIASRNARLLIEGSTTVQQDITLNNSTGFAYGGALLTSRSLGGYAGNIELGDQGSVVGLDTSSGNLRLNISGSLRGGALHLIGDGDIRLLTDNHSYTGSTSIGHASLRGTTVELRDDCALLTTNAITVHDRASLTANNDETFSNSGSYNRIDDTAPIMLLGGTFTLRGRTGQTIDEAVGAVTAAQNASQIVVFSIDNTNNPRLTVESLAR